MATNNIFCGICELRKLSRDPVVWCSDCDEALCTDCSEHHALSKSTRQHNTVPIDEYKTLPPFILNIKQFCDKHNEKFQTFCKTHDCPCCRKCAVEKHNKCTDIVVLEDVIHHVKTSPKTQEVMTQLTEMADNIEKIQMNRTNNAQSLKKERKMIEKEISETRKNINDHLDSLQDKLMKELTDAEIKVNNQIQEIITALKEKENEINEMKAGLDNIKKNASDLQAFLGMKQIESVSVETENYIQRLVESGHVNPTILSCKMSDIKISIGNIQSYGEIIVDTKPCNVAIEVGKHKQAQMFVVSLLPKSVDNVTLKLDRIVEHDTKYIWGCCLLPNGSMIFSSRKDQSICLLNKDGSKDFTVDLGPGDPNGVTCIDKSNIAVAVANSVRIINIDNTSVHRTTRDLGGSVGGITYKDGTLLCCINYKGILSMNLDNDTVTTVVSCLLSPYPDVTTNDNNIYYTDRHTHAVTCCDMTGTTQWQFNDTSILRDPISITVDRNGIIYVVGYASHNVVVISPDGKQYKEVLSRQDELNKPTVIHCDKSTNKLLVANHNLNAWLFNVE